VVTFQSIVAREVNPLDSAVVTVGTFHAGTKRNIIPDEAKIELTVRSYKPEVQKQLLAAIARIAKAEAAAAGASREPRSLSIPPSPRRRSTTTRPSPRGWGMRFVGRSVREGRRHRTSDGL